MQMRSAKETLISILCCAVAGVALASGMWIAASPTHGGSGVRLAESLGAVVCTGGAACAANAHQGAPAPIPVER